MTETGIQRVVVGRVRRWLHVLREDLCTLRADPLPPSVWLRWLPHGLLCMVAFGVTLGVVAQLTDNGGVGGALAFAIGLAQGAAVVFALWRPVPAWWVSNAAMLVGAIEVRRQLLAGGAEGFTWPWSPGGLIGHLAVLLLLALRVRTRVAVEALAVTLLLTYLVEGVLGAAAFQPTGVLAATLFTVVVVLGTALRGRREASRALVEQTTLTSEERARRTLLEERSRIARELHDVVAHHMSVISIQAQVAPHLVENPTEELRDNLAGIRQNALEALTELRRVLGVLRAEHPDPVEESADPATGTAPHAPQPTLDRVEALVENTRAAGLAVTLRFSGERWSLPSGVELSAYRIVQEALSNVLRHAPGAEAGVHISYQPIGVVVEVANTRPTSPPPPSEGAGHGLLGMRERATMLGGALLAGPQQEGGYKVYAYLPTSPTGGPSGSGAATEGPSGRGARTDGPSDPDTSLVDDLTLTSPLMTDRPSRPGSPADRFSGPGSPAEGSLGQGFPPEGSPGPGTPPVGDLAPASPLMTDGPSCPGSPAEESSGQGSPPDRPPRLGTPPVGDLPLASLPMTDEPSRPTSPTDRSSRPGSPTDGLSPPASPPDGPPRPDTPPATDLPPATPPTTDLPAPPPGSTDRRSTDASSTDPRSADPRSTDRRSTTPHPTDPPPTDPPPTLPPAPAPVDDPKDDTA